MRPCIKSFLKKFIIINKPPTGHKVCTSHNDIISIDSNSLKTRGNKFAFAFMRNAVGRSEISLYITTKQDVSALTIETRLPGLVGFNEVSPDSGLFSRTGTAQRGGISQSFNCKLVE